MASSTKVDMSPAAIAARLRRVGELTDLHHGTRLDTKIDMSPAAVTARLREAWEMYELCLALRPVAPPPTEERKR